MWFQVTQAKVGKWKAERDIAKLVKCLADDDEAIRIAALHALMELKDTFHAKEVAHMLSDAKESVRREAAKTLTEIATAPIVPELAEALKDSDVEVRSSVAKALTLIATPKAIALVIDQIAREQEREHVPEMIESLLGKVGGAHAVTLVKLLLALRKSAKHDKIDARAAQSLQFVIEALGQQAIPALLGHIKEVNKDDQLLLISMTATIGGDAAAAALEPLIRDSDPDLQLAVLLFLSKHEGSEPRDGWFLVAVLSTTKTLAERLQIIINLRLRSAIPESVKPWAAYWLDEGEEALINTPIQKYRQEFTLGAHHPEAEVRYRSMRALMLLGDSLALGSLVERLLDSDPKVRAITLSMMAIFTRESNLELFEIWSGLSDPIAMHAKESPARCYMVKVLHDPVPLVRARAAYLIGLSQDPDLISPLKRLLEDPSPIVRFWATDAVRRIEPLISDAPMMPSHIGLEEFERITQERTGV